MNQYPNQNPNQYQQQYPTQEQYQGMYNSSYNTPPQVPPRIHTGLLDPFTKRGKSKAKAFFNLTTAITILSAIAQIYMLVSDNTIKKLLHMDIGFALLAIIIVMLLVIFVFGGPLAVIVYGSLGLFFSIKEYRRTKEARAGIYIILLSVMIIFEIIMLVLVLPK